MKIGDNTELSSIVLYHGVQFLTKEQWVLINEMITAKIEVN